MHKWAEYNIVYFAVQCIFITFAAKYNQYEYNCLTSVSAWNVPGTEQEAGVQIDLLIQRDDKIVNLCEMKFYGAPLSIDKEEEAKMLYRVEMLKKTLSAKQTVHLTLVTTFGLVHGKHSGKVQKIITIDDFFT